MAYSKTVWVNDNAPALNATNLNKIENGIYDNSLDIAKLPVLLLDCATVSSLPATFSDAKITDDMVVVKAELGTPSAQTSDWSVETSDGSLTVSGTISGSTTLTLFLCKSR
ncbi:MAG: hypothetical protein II544_02170 [Spirochaetales bacterium]|jgi:hypothetical protein|nr:hypothetical protein [Spirochaetales bacterium]